MLPEGALPEPVVYDFNDGYWRRADDAWERERRCPEPLPRVAEFCSVCWSWKCSSRD